ncbi:hypothetical protein BDV95DRAFT_572245 [Massariosphaeria phaeospora]|uniref:Killer toxin Kp4 domain-containing protein n=1 Tax=Massariosphaeria phaeospora TaxID=100035 RepID=A0A7C8M5W4_9PLEO|nr:hypothetical protein BDV95DRAFT_572245 [Massariosphaeria phaeospora]
MKVSILATVLAFSSTIWAVALPNPVDNANTNGLTNPNDNAGLLSLDDDMANDNYLPSTYYADDDTAPGTSTVASVLNPSLGINCRGSIMCMSCGGQAELASIALGIPDKGRYVNGEQIACTNHCFGTIHTKWDGLCIFPQFLAKGQEISGASVKHKVKELIKKCDKCGSVPFSGDDIYKGEITINFVRKGCGNRVCKS